VKYETQKFLLENLGRGNFGEMDGNEKILLKWALNTF
jgi:hypothetical protein